MEQMNTIIVAYDKNYGIGVNNDLLWQRDLPADLKHFKDTTMGGAIIMGFNTYRSIGRPLSGRQNIIISDKNEPIEGFEVANSLRSAYEIVESGKETFVIGGGQVYALAIGTVDRILATEVDVIFNQATVFFPEINTNIWREVEREKHRADGANLYNYDFVTYERV